MTVQQVLSPPPPAAALTTVALSGREAHLRFGGPDGGSGGMGGSVVVVADRMTRTLAPVRKHYTARAGGNGKGADCQGRNGQDVVIKVARALRGAGVQISSSAVCCCYLFWLMFRFP